MGSSGGNRRADHVLMAASNLRHDEQNASQSRKELFYSPPGSVVSSNSWGPVGGGLISYKLPPGRPVAPIGHFIAAITPGGRPQGPNRPVLITPIKW